MNENTSGPSLHRYLKKAMVKTAIGMTFAFSTICAPSLIAEGLSSVLDTPPDSNVQVTSR